MPGVPPHISQLIDAYLVEIGALFQPEARITLLVRSPQIPDGSGDLLMTTDAVPKIRETLKRLAREGTWETTDGGTRSK
jgi:hypothetical protein